MYCKKATLRQEQFSGHLIIIKRSSRRPPAKGRLLIAMMGRAGSLLWGFRGGLRFNINMMIRAGSLRFSMQARASVFNMTRLGGAHLWHAPTGLRPAIHT